MLVSQIQGLQNKALNHHTVYLRQAKVSVIVQQGINAPLQTKRWPAYSKCTEYAPGRNHELLTPRGLFTKSLIVLPDSCLAGWESRVRGHGSDSLSFANLF